MLVGPALLKLAAGLVSVGEDPTSTTLPPLCLLPSTPSSSLVNHLFGSHFKFQHPLGVVLRPPLFSTCVFSSGTLTHTLRFQGMLVTVYAAACQTFLLICPSTLTSAHQKLNTSSALLPTSNLCSSCILYIG